MWPLRSWPEYLEKLLPSRNECYLTAFKNYTKLDIKIFRSFQ